MGVTAQTLRNWDRNGYLKSLPRTDDKQTRYYKIEDVNNVLHKEEIEKKIVGYCRVSSQKQKDDLERQVENVKTYLYAKGYRFVIITGIGSGINYSKKGLQQLMTMINNQDVSKVVVLYKDRLLRFGFELIEYFAKINDCEIEIID